MARGTTPIHLLITGGSGFVGRHLFARLKDRLPAGSMMVNAGRKAAGLDGVTDRFLDITDAAAVDALIGELQPTHLVHLAAVASVAHATVDPRSTWTINTIGSLNVALATAGRCPDCRLLHISSSEIYGTSFRRGEQLDETAPLKPTSPYAASKAAADLMMGQMAEQGLAVLRARPFNHTGPGQGNAFVIPSFAEQIARIELGLQEPVIHVGNLDVYRDFLDVHDVIAAYEMMLFLADPPRGLILNIASERTRRIADVLDALLALSPAKVSVVQDPSRLRPSETPVVVGNAGRAHEILGWAPQIPWEVTLQSVLDDCRRRLRAG